MSGYQSMWTRALGSDKQEERTPTLLIPASLNTCQRNSMLSSTLTGAIVFSLRRLMMYSSVMRLMMTVRSRVFVARNESDNWETREVNKKENNEW